MAPLWGRCVGIANLSAEKGEIMNNLESDGYNVIMDEVRVSHDPHDPWGSNIGWMFALADCMWAHHDERLESYTPSPIIDKGESSMLDASIEFDALTSHEESWTYEDVRRVYTILSRYDDWLRLAGKNY